MALSHAPSLVTDGLIIYLDANNSSSYAGTGSTWYDLSGNGRHASLISSPTYEGFGLGKYLSFDGSTNYATIPYTITDNSITVGFWYYSKIFSANSSLDALISNFTFGISGFDVRLNSSTTINLAIVIDGSQSLVNIGTITNNTWYFIAFTYDGATVKTYIDGALGSSTNVVGTRANGTQICIGTSAYDTNRKATCGIPQVMIYNRALSDSEILQNYNATKKRYSPDENIARNGLVFNLDAGNARSYAGTGNTAYDIAGTGITASLVNGVGFNNANSGSFVFDGTNDYVNCGNILDNPSDFTIVAWQKSTLRFYQLIVAKVNDVDAGPGWAMHAGDFIWGVAAFSQTNATNWKLFYTGKMVDDGIWHHLAAVYVNKLVTGIYVDGISYPFTTLSDGTLTSMSNPLSVRIGTDQTNEYMFRGNISQVQLYSRALTSTEILQNYNALKTRYGLS